MRRLVHIAKTLLAWAVVQTGLLRLVHRWRGPHVLVLAYHRVTPGEELDRCAYPAMHVSTQSFDAQLGVLKRLYRVVPATELRGLLQRRTPLDAPVAVVTFDDGYRDNYRYALPILAKHGVPATFFLAVDFVERGEPFWFDRLAAAVRVWDADAAVREQAAASLPAPLVAALAASGGFRHRLRAAAAWLKALPDAERDAAVDTVAATLGGGDVDPDAVPLDWDEVRALRAAGMSIGAHGVRHAILTRMEPRAAAAEIQQSVEALSRRTGSPVRAFAYPNGDADETIARLAAAAGVEIAFTMQGRDVRPGDDLLRLGRRNVCEDTSRGAFGRFSRAYFECEISGVFDFVLRRGRRTG